MKDMDFEQRAEYRETEANPTMAPGTMTKEKKKKKKRGEGGKRGKGGEKSRFPKIRHEHLGFSWTRIYLYHFAEGL